MSDSYNTAVRQITYVCDNNNFCYFGGGEGRRGWGWGGEEGLRMGGGRRGGDGGGGLGEGEEGWVWGRVRRGRGGGRRSRGAVSGHNLIRSSHSIS